VGRTFGNSKFKDSKIQNSLHLPPGTFLPTFVGRGRGRGEIQDLRFKDSKIRTTLLRVSDILSSLAGNAIELSYNSLKGGICITAGQRPAEGSPFPLSLPEFYD
jgi:hypothetical protein